MHIGIVGTGYVGLITSVCFAHLGHKVIGLDKRANIIAKLSKGEPTIYEKGLKDLLQTEVKNKSLTFTTQIEDLSHCDIVFLAVGTPPLPNGSADLSQVYDVVSDLLDVIDESTMIAVRSTIPVGTMASIKKILTQKNKKNHLGFCPEFLREGLAVSDFLNPYRVVLASDSENGRTLLKEVYKPLVEPNNIPQIVCDTFETAEIIKYASNVYLATKITFTNQMAQLAQQANADIYKIVQAMGLDSRIGNKFLQPGPGYGGSCFPKDTMALARVGLEYGVDMSLVEEVHKANVAHKKFISSWMIQSLNSHNIHGDCTNTSNRPKIAVWGLTFKANTDDVRDSSSISIIENFIDTGFDVQAYDPEGSQNFIEIFKSPHVSIHNSALEAVQSCCALVILTEWEEFSKIPASDVQKKIQEQKKFFVFDTRNILVTDDYKKHGISLSKLGVSQT